MKHISNVQYSGLQLLRGRAEGSEDNQARTTPPGGNGGGSGPPFGQSCQVGYFEFYDLSPKRHEEKSS